MRKHRKKKHEEIEPEIESVKEGTIEQRSEKIKGEECDNKLKEYQENVRKEEKTRKK